MTTATETVTISVTQEHIERGLPDVCDECAMAKAFLASLPGAAYVKVRYWDHLGDDAREPEVHVTVDFNAGATRYYRLPYEAAGFVPRFDSGLPVFPFAFEAEVLPS
jgi:hypothetical protein